MPIRPARLNAADQLDNLAAVVLLAWAMTRPLGTDPVYLIRQWEDLKSRLST
jgi:hypothetical protein